MQFPSDKRGPSEAAVRRHTYREERKVGVKRQEVTSFTELLTTVVFLVQDGTDDIQNSQGLELR